MTSTASSAFYRKWRSQKFADLVGQPAVSQTLRNAVKNRRIAHAYLFCGPRGVGKTSAARILAKAINCPNTVDGEPCAVCETCLAIQEGRQLDVIELDAASNNGIEEIRDIREKAGLAPSQLRYKFYILDEAHMLSGPAFNGLLKTLEEPPPNTVFVLVTTDPQRIPETIVSRCQRLDLRRITVPDAIARLRFVCEQEGISPQDGVLEILARSASGSLRDAEGSLDQLVAYAGLTPTIAATRSLLGAAGPEAARDLVDLVVSDRIADAIRLVNNLVDQGADSRQVALDVVDTLRSMLLLRTSETLIDLVEVGPEEIDALRPIADRLTSPLIVTLIRAFTPGPSTRGGLRSQLPLEMSVVEAGQALRWARADSVKSQDPTSLVPAPGQSVGRPQRATAEPRAPAFEPTPLAVSNEPTASDPSAVAVSPMANDGSVDTRPALDLAAPPSAGRPLDGDIIVDEATRRWTEVLDVCGTKNRSVQALLRSAFPLRSDAEGLVLGFPYAFHRERIADLKNRAVVEDVIEQVLGQRVRIRCEVSSGRDRAVKTDPAQAALDDPLVRAAIAMGASVTAVSDNRPEVKS